MGKVKISPQQIRLNMIMEYSIKSNTSNIYPVHIILHIYIYVDTHCNVTGMMVNKGNDPKWHYFKSRK